MKFCVLCGKQAKNNIICSKCEPQAPDLLDWIQAQIDELIRIICKKDSSYYYYIGTSANKTLTKAAIEEPPWKEEKRRLEREKVAKQAQEKVEAKKQAAKNAKLPIHVDKEKLLDGLKSRIIGQDTVLNELASVVKVHLAKQAPQRPLTAFLAGKTGIGKSQSIIALVDVLNNILKTPVGFIRIDCNLYTNSYRAAANFAGSPLGFRDSSEPSTFVPLIDNPRTIILFDEIEKAHPNMLTAIMGIIDYGKLTLASKLKERDKDGNPIIGNEGKEGIDEIFFQNAVIVFTSNLDLDPTAKRVGFLKDDSTDLISADERCKEALTKITRAEVAGRISYFLQYEPLTNDSMKQIVKFEIGNFCGSFGLFAGDVSDDILDGIVKSCGNKFGARTHIQKIERIFGEQFAEWTESGDESPSIDIMGTLDSIEIIPRYDHEQIDPDDLYGNDEFPF